MDIDDQDSGKIMSGNNNDNGQSDNMSNEQSNTSVQNSSCSEPSIGNVNGNVLSEVNVGNIVKMLLVMTVQFSVCNSTSGNGPRVAKSVGSRVKTQASGSSSSPVPSVRARTSPWVQSQTFVIGQAKSDS